MTEHWKLARFANWSGCWAGALLPALAGCSEGPDPTTVEPAAAVVSQSAATVQSETAGDAAAPSIAAPAQPPRLRPTSSEADALFAALATPETTPEEWERAQERLVELGEEAVPTLARELTSSDAFHREVAASALAMLGPAAAGAQSELRDALADETVHVRANAATALCALPDQAEVVIPVLTALLVSDDPQVRQMSAVNLSSFGDEAAPCVPQLVAALKTAPDDVVVAIVELLGRIGPEAQAAAPELRQIAFEQEGDAQQAATAALERIGGTAKGE